MQPVLISGECPGSRLGLCLGLEDWGHWAPFRMGTKGESSKEPDEFRGFVLNMFGGVPRNRVYVQ